MFLKNYIIASDPGLVRLKYSLRILLATLISTGVLIFTAGQMGISPALSIFGAMISMMSTLSINDNTRKEQQITYLLISLVAALSLIIGIAVHHVDWLSITIFLLLIFIAVFIRKYGPRGGAFGLIIFNTYFFVLFIQANFELLPFLLVSVFAASAASYITRFHLLDDNREKKVKNIIRAYYSQVCIIIYRCVNFLEKSSDPEKFKFITRSHQEKLNDISIMLEEEISDEHKWLNELIDNEISVETLAYAVWNLKKSTSLSKNDLHLLSRILKEGLANHNFDPASYSVELYDICERTNDAKIKLYISRLSWALDKISFNPEYLQKIDQLQLDKNIINNIKPLKRDISLDIKESVKSVIAAGLSVIAGKMISPDRWYWAVITAYILFTTTETVGETLSKSWQRIFGTAIGIIIGLAIAEYITMPPTAEFIFIFLMIFFAFYFMMLSYAVMITLFTAVLAMLYKMMGQFHSDIMFVRLEETLVGGVIGALVAIFVFPSNTRKKLNTSIADVITMITDLVAKRASDKSAQGSRTRLLSDLKKIEKQLQQLRTAYNNSQFNIIPFMPAKRNRIGHSVSILVFAFKHYLITATERESEPDFRNTILEIEKILQHNIKAALHSIKKGKKGELKSAAPLFEKLSIPSDDKNLTRKQLKIQWLELMNEHINIIAS